MMQSTTTLPLQNAPEKSTLGVILHRGWLNIKTRSMVNMRPRHMRYCVLTRDNQMLSTFKFQPSAGDLQSPAVKPLRAYKVLGVAPWNGRKFAFLLSVTQQSDNVDHMLEVDSPTEVGANEWLKALRMVIDGTGLDVPAVMPPPVPVQRSQSEGDAYPAPAPAREIEADLYVKGASVHRGLLNASGENSCFLNVIIQSFWHLTSMRQYLLHVEIKDDSRSVEANVLRALKTIMTLYDDTTSGTIHSRALRKGLSVLYGADKNFQEGAMYDAEETLLALLNLMHKQTDSTEVKNTQTTSAMVKSLVRVVSQDSFAEETPLAVFDENSIPHLVFSHQIYDRYVCPSCRHSTPWDMYSNLVYTTYAVDVAAAKCDSMEQMLRSLALQADVATACEQKGCTGKMAKERVIKRFPMVFVISILWSTNSATKEQVHGVTSNISRTIDLAKCFEPTGSIARFKNGGIRTTYKLRGFVCYYGQHYVSLFYSTAHKEWLMFDDSRVREMGSWEAVVAQCLKCRFQIVLMYYEVPDQRKDSSVNVFGSSLGLGLGASPADMRRRKSSSMSSVQSDLNPPTILEDEDFVQVETPRPASKSGALPSVDEDLAASQLAAMGDIEPGAASEPSSTDAAAGFVLPPLPFDSAANDEDDPELFGPAAAIDSIPSTSPSDDFAAHDNTAKVQDTDTDTTIVNVLGNRAVELAEAKRAPHQAILPVSSAIAMAPLTGAMNSPLGPNEYDVRFGDDCMVLGMYLEKLDGDLCVTEFPRSSTGEMFGAERCGRIGLFDLILQANGYPMQHYPVDRALNIIKGQRRPLLIRFRRSPRVQQLVEMGFSREAAALALSQTHGNVAVAADRFFDA